MGFCLQSWLDVLPAAATITTSLSIAAYRIAPPRDRWSMTSNELMHDTSEMLMILAPMSAACTIARAIDSMSPALRRVAGSSLPNASFGLNAWLLCRIEISCTSGAPPLNPSAAGGGGSRGAGAGVSVGSTGAGGASGEEETSTCSTCRTPPGPGCHAAPGASGGGGGGGGTWTMTV